MAFTQISPRRWERVVEFRLEFDDLKIPGAGSTFPCDADGNVDVASLPEAALENYARCMRGEGVGPAYITDLSRDVRVDADKRCDRCGGESYFGRSCGVDICGSCGRHEGLARCFCGWSLSGRNGRQELEELGEVIDDD